MARMSLQAAHQQARQWLESNDLDRAVGLAQHILESYPSNLEAFRILGEAQLAQRQLDRAQDSFDRVLRSDPENIPAHVGLGITFERRGQLERAVSEFEQALEIKPDMPELRSQLLRLYAEAWGSENAQLRLSRAGLARLYAKGHMLPQAIVEFRQVIADQPERWDARVALAETLWRNEQEDAAADTCREILAERPESLKANLILGYLELAAGRPEGDSYWQRAYQMDPYQAVAQALFETLPPVPEEPTLLEWDELTWRSRRDEELYEEQIAATRPMENPALVLDDERDTPVLRSVPLVSAAAASAPVAAEDDFLASLLALDTPPAPRAAPTPAAAPIPAPVAAEPPAPVEDDLGLDDVQMTPFSLADLGLSDDEIAGLEGAGEVSAAPDEPEDEPELSSETRPFSLAELGLDDAPAEDAPAAEIPTATPEPVAAAPEPVAAPEPAAPAPEPVSDDLDEPQMTPFTLADLGLSDDEIASLESIDDLSAAAPATPQAADDDDPEIDMTPFSLADLGLSDDEIAGIEGATAAAEASAEADADFDLGDLPADLQPFSIDELDLNSTGGSDVGQLPSALQPFSLDDTPQQPPRPRMSGLAAEEPYEAPAEEEEPLPGPRGFSWQQPTQRSEPGFVSSMRPEAEAPQGSIFEKLQHTRPPAPPDEPPPAVPIDEHEHLGLFSLDNISLRDDEPLADAPAAETPAAEAAPHAHTPAPEVDNLEDALASGVIQPFSFADLGLSDEEIAALGLGGETPAETPAVEEPAAEEPAAEVAPTESFDFGLDEVAPTEPVTESFDFGLDEVAPAAEAAPHAHTPAPEVDNLEDALASGVIQPFSFADLGLSDEEIAALGLGGETPAVEEPAAEEPAAEVAPTESFDFGLDEVAPAEPAAPTEPPRIVIEHEDAPVGTGLLQPFSLADLGLSDDELGDAALDLDDDDDSRLGLTEDELDGLASGGDVDWAKVGLTPEQEAEPEVELAADEPAGDVVVERLIALGRQQGFVDISDIIAAVENPEEQSDRIEEIGQRLHEASVEIRDGDEVIDLDAEYEDEEAADIVAEVEDESVSVAGEEMTPFSLHDLGLSDEEIAMLGLGGEAPPAAETPASEESLEPFSLDDLGIPSTIDPLDLADAAETAPASPVAEEPADLQPFSLSELGLTDDEIAMLGLNDAAPAAEPVAEAPAAPELADLQPFSLSELGLTDDEIAVLGLGGEPAAEAPAAVEPSAVPEPPAALEVPATPVAPEPPAPAPAVPAVARPPAAAVGITGNEMVDTLARQVNADPSNHVLRIALARVGGQVGLTDLALQQYRELIKHGVMLEDIVEDIGDLIAETGDERVLRRLHKALGDVYSKQGRFAEAVTEYSWPAGG